MFLIGLGTIAQMIARRLAIEDELHEHHLAVLCVKAHFAVRAASLSPGKALHKA